MRVLVITVNHNANHYMNKILAIYSDLSARTVAKVGANGVTKIDESPDGYGNNTLYVYRGEDLFMRMNSALIVVEYETPGYKEPEPQF